MSATGKSRKKKSSAPRTVVVSASSSGRVTTATVDASPPPRRVTNNDIFMPVQPMASTSAALPSMADYPVPAPTVYGPLSLDTFDPTLFGFDLLAAQNSISGETACSIHLFRPTSRSAPEWMDFRTSPAHEKKKGGCGCRYF
ncbi:hypothetical protein FB451DRAFT_1398752 [Mycena latifolia]|nr:hypothetical protein FB451DRAFT_1398752 [Mycena latifolia]